jgi:tetratricopeptide (TPR) repeat protein
MLHHYGKIKITKLLVLVFFISSLGSNVTFAQDYGNNTDPLKLCVAIQSNNFISDAEAENALDRILSVIGASKRFVLQPCDNINNAVAISYKGIRYILYDKAFMNSLASGNDWGNLFILAHEVGHHINGHSLDLVLYAAEAVEAETLASKRQQELEADEFAGFVLGKLGASLLKITTVLNSIANDRDDTYSTHPAKSKRLLAVGNGYNRALEKVNLYDKSPDLEITQKPTSTLDLIKTGRGYFDRAYEKAQRKDFDGAKADYTKAIELGVSYSAVYHNRGMANSELKRYNDALIDFNKAIELKSNFANYYVSRGQAKSKLMYKEEAIEDFAKAIELDPLNWAAFYSRGKLKFELELYKESITDFNKSVEIDPSNGLAFYGRGYSKHKLGERNEACKDAQKAQSLGYDSSDLVLITCK